MSDYEAWYNPPEGLTVIKWTCYDGTPETAPNVAEYEETPIVVAQATEDDYITIYSAVAHIYKGVLRYSIDTSDGEMFDFVPGTHWCLGIRNYLAGRVSR